MVISEQLPHTDDSTFCTWSLRNIFDTTQSKTSCFDIYFSHELLIEAVARGCLLRDIVHSLDIETHPYRWGHHLRTFALDSLTLKKRHKKSWTTCGAGENLCIKSCVAAVGFPRVGRPTSLMQIKCVWNDCASFTSTLAVLIQTRTVERAFHKTGQLSPFMVIVEQGTSISLKPSSQ